MRRAACLLLSLLALPSLASTALVRADAADDAGAGAPDARAVLAQFAKVEALSAHFHEEKHMALLAQPLRSEGTLHYAKPRLLVRHTERPHASTVLLRGDTLSFGDDKHQESLALSSQPALGVLVDTFVSVLAGDLTALTRAADVSSEAGGHGGFRIRVIPKDAKVKRLVRAMTFEGQGARLSRMELLDANGDTTITTFSEVTVHKPASAAEQARIFRIGR